MLSLQSASVIVCGWSVSPPQLQTAAAPACLTVEGCRFLGDETFQKEIMICPIHGKLEEDMLWNVERMVDSHPPPTHCPSASHPLPPLSV